MESLTQAEEDALAVTMAGQPQGKVIIFNSTISQVRIWGGSAFENPPVNSLYLTSTNNLSDVANSATARNNILPSRTGNAGKVLKVSVDESGYELGTVSGAGDLLAANNLSDLQNVATARTNMGLNTNANQSDSLNKRFVTDAQLTVLGNTSGSNTGDNATNAQYSGLAVSKQDVLVSGTNIKTINGQSVLGSGNLVVGGGSGISQAQAQTLAFMRT